MNQRSLALETIQQPLRYAWPLKPHGFEAERFLGRKFYKKTKNFEQKYFCIFLYYKTFYGRKLHIFVIS